MGLQLLGVEAVPPQTKLPLLEQLSPRLLEVRLAATGSLLSLLMASCLGLGIVLAIAIASGIWLARRYTTVSAGLVSLSTPCTNTFTFIRTGTGRKGRETKDFSAWVPSLLNIILITYSRHLFDKFLYVQM